MYWSFLDTWIVVAGVLSAMSCALVGNFLVLRKMSMMGDAISHAVLPGLAIAFLVTLSRESFPMFVGAAVVGVLTAALTQLIFQFGKIDQGAAMGVVFTSLFAVGLILIVRAADAVDLDPGCVLYGSIELIPLHTRTLLGFEIPSAVIGIGAVFLVDILVVVLLFKELNISSFDPGLATTLGINANLMHYLLMTLVAMTTVAAFQSVGSIMVIAMLIVPPAVAHLYTNRLQTMILVSLGIAAVSAALGHISAITVPTWFGFTDTISSGMMAAVSGAMLFVSLLISPKSGIVTQWLNKFRLNLQVADEDIVAGLYRHEERANGADGGMTIEEIAALEDSMLASYRRSSLLQRVALNRLVRRGGAVREAGRYRLSEKGRAEAASFIRSHRLWESYLHTEGAAGDAGAHFPAQQLEHVTSGEILSALSDHSGHLELDPDGKPIPSEG